MNQVYNSRTGNTTKGKDILTSLPKMSKEMEIGLFEQKDR